MKARGIQPVVPDEHAPQSIKGSALFGMSTSSYWLGSLTIVGSTVMLLLGLEFGGVIHPWKSAIIICLIIFRVIAAGGFILIEWKIARYPPCHCGYLTLSPTPPVLLPVSFTESRLWKPHSTFLFISRESWELPRFFPESSFYPSLVPWLCLLLRLAYISRHQAGI